MSDPAARWGHLGAEAAAIVKQGRLLLQPRRRGVPHAFGSSAEAQPRTVVFVHGYGAGAAVFDPLREHLETGLGVSTVAYGYRPAWSFDRVAHGFARLVDRLARESKLDVVAHSLGGLVTRWYLQELSGQTRVRRAVFLATPHRGTHRAGLALGPLGRALRPDGLVVRRLHAGRERAAAVAHTALVAGADLLITPPASAAALPDADVHWFEQLGHNGMLFDPRVHAVVARTIGQDGPNRGI